MTAFSTHGTPHCNRSATAGVPLASTPLHHPLRREMSEVTDQAPVEEPTSVSVRTDAPTARRDFGLLWAGQSLSLVGDQCMRVALPLLAVSVLGASAAQAALLPFALFVPFLLFGLPAGAIVDRLRRRPV